MLRTVPTADSPPPSTAWPPPDAVQLAFDRMARAQARRFEEKRARSLERDATRAG